MTTLAGGGVCAGVVTVLSGHDRPERPLVYPSPTLREPHRLGVSCYGRRCAWGPNIVVVVVNTGTTTGKSKASPVAWSDGDGAPVLRLVRNGHRQSNCAGSCLEEIITTRIGAVA